MGYSEACEELVSEIQKNEVYPFQYALMLMTFIQSKENGDTNRMALALAIDAIKAD